MACERRGESGVWITGVGAATPLGDRFEAIAAGLLEGRSGVAGITEFPLDGQPSRIAGRVGPIACPAGWAETEEEFRSRRPLEQAVLWCCAEALRDAGWWDRRGAVRLGLVLGLGAEWLNAWELEGHRTGSGSVEDPSGSGPMVETARRELGLSGPVLTLSAACASANHALAHARRWIERGWADICLAGACDMSVTPMALACFGNLRALSRRNDEPRAASRPFDRGRDGFVMGEGGALFVLEGAATARRRGARAYAEVAGFGATSDAHHPVIPSPDPGPAALAIRQALDDACLAPDDVGYVNAHATGTPLGDVLEASALKAALGDASARVPVSSTKSMTGHLLTASGAVECLACLAALDRQALPPTINLDDPDPQCAGLNHVRNEARPHAFDVAISNSFGFGGSNTCLVLRAV
jgi:3-oxoacyl-[acyl-carrier-protein] synthase II